MKEQNLNLISEYSYLEKLDKLNEIARLMNSATDLNEVLKLILDQGIQLLGVNYGDLWLVEKQTGDLLLLYSTHDNKHPKGTKRIKKLVDDLLDVSLILLVPMDAISSSSNCSGLKLSLCRRSKS